MTLEPDELRLASRAFAVDGDMTGSIRAKSMHVTAARARLRRRGFALRRASRIGQPVLASGNIRVSALSQA